MARPKIPRKSTAVDMTAMCDVAFLLLSFFILTTKFKADESVTVQTPNSVANKIAPEKDVVLITLTKDGKVFLSAGDNSSDKQHKHDIIASVNESRNLGLSKTDIDALTRAPFLGVPLAQLNQQARLQTDQMNDKTLPGIPTKDSANNEMIDWMRAVSDVYQGTKVNILLKGDNVAKYPYFKNVLTSLKKNKLFKFQMVTNPESVPQGSDLWKENMSGKATE